MALLSTDVASTMKSKTNPERTSVQPSEQDAACHCLTRTGQQYCSPLSRSRISLRTVALLSRHGRKVPSVNALTGLTDPSKERQGGVQEGLGCVPDPQCLRG